MAQPVGPATLLVYCFLGQFGLIGLNHFLSASSRAPPATDTAAPAVSVAPSACPSCPEVEGCELFPWLVRVGLAFVLGGAATVIVLSAWVIAVGGVAGLATGAGLTGLFWRAVLGKAGDREEEDRYQLIVPCDTSARRAPSPEVQGW